MSESPSYLSELLQGLVTVTDAHNVLIRGVTTDSRLVKPGYLFIAYGGTKCDGLQYIDEAVSNGAVAVLYEQKAETHDDIPTIGLPMYSLPDPQATVSLIAARFYQHPGRALDIIGITGTNGKTSCTHYLAQVLSYLNRESAVIGTMGCGRLNALVSTGLTTPDAISTQALLQQFQQSGVQTVAMEVSSHALAQNRVSSVPFDSVVFTNLTQDHLDYHASMDDYAATKARLFTQFDYQHAIINIDDAVGQTLVKKIPVDRTCLTFSLQNTAADIFVSAVHRSLHGMAAKVHSPWGTGALQTQLLGDFNLANLLVVIACLCLRGHALDSVLQVLSLTRSPAGRMTVFKSRNEVALVVDYAHTPDALQQALAALKAHCTGKLWCVLGCGGDRDRSKRQLIGKISEQYADRVTITNDNPRYEDPRQIVNDILRGCQHPEKIDVALDRKVAISRAFEQAASGDMILIAGKGHETEQLIQGEAIPFSDLEIAQELVKTTHECF